MVVRALLPLSAAAAKPAGDPFATSERRGDPLDPRSQERPVLTEGDIEYGREPSGRLF